MANSVIQSGQSLSGTVDVIRTDGGGLRRCQMDGIVLNTDDKLRAFKAWQAEFAGGTRKVVVPIASNRLAPRPLQGGRPTRYGDILPQSDDPYFPEASGYALEMVKAKTIQPAAFRAMEITLTMMQGDVIRGGETFSIEHTEAGHHVYEINRVLSRDGDDYTVKLDCPLRERLTGFDPLNFDWPMFEAYLLPDMDIAPQIENKRAEVSLSFREAL